MKPTEPGVLPRALRSGWPAAVLLVVLALLAAFQGVFLAGESLAALPGLTGLEPPPPGTKPPPVMDISSAYIDEPLARLASDQLATGRLPLWNPFNGLGQPLLGNMQSALLSPFRWPALLSSSPLVVDLALFARIAFAALSTLLLGRALGLGPLGAGLAGVGYGLTGYLVMHVNMHHLSIEVLVPGLLWATVRLADQPRAGRSLALLLFSWGAWVGGNPEATLVAALLAAAVLLARTSKAAFPWQARGRVILWALLGTLLAGPYLVPGLEHLAHGLHHHGGATGTDAYRPWCAAGLFMPGYYLSAPQPLASLRPPWFGVALALLACLGALTHPVPDRFPRKTLSLLALLLLLKALGTPGLNLLGTLPILEMMLFHKYGLPAIALCLALLAGLGAERRSQKRALPATLVACAFGLCLFGLHHWNLAEAQGRAGFEGFDPTLLPRLWPLVTLAALLWIVRGRLLGPLVVGLAALELVLAVPSERPTRRDPFEPPSYARALLAEIERGTPVRSLSTGALVVDPESQMPLFPETRGRLSPNTGAALGIPDLRINDAIIVRRFGRFAEALVDGRMQAGILEPGLFPAFTEAELHASEFFLKKWFFRDALAQSTRPGLDRPAAALLGGNAVLDALGISHLILEEHPDLRGRLAREQPDRWEAQVAEDGVTLYRNLHSPGRAFLPERIEAAANEKEALDWVVANQDDLLQAAVVEGAPEEWLGAQARAPGDRVTSRLAPGRDLILETTLAAPRVLLISEVWYPGRRVRLEDGRALPCRPGQLCFTAVRVPEGRQVLRVDLRPTSFAAGCLLAGIGAVLAALCLAAPRRRRSPWQVNEVTHGSNLPHS